MFASLTVVSFIFAFAWIQQQFLNRLIEADLKALEEAQHNSHKRPSDPKLH